MRVELLARRLLKRAWDDDIRDDDRLLMERAACEIDRLSRRCLRVAQALELAELRHKEGLPNDEGL
jgi:hypothetical protein